MQVRSPAAPAPDVYAHAIAAHDFLSVASFKTDRKRREARFRGFSG
jgi:hypothetical protein